MGVPSSSRGGGRLGQDLERCQQIPVECAVHAPRGPRELLRGGPPLGLSLAVALVLRIAALAAALPDPARFLTLDGREYLALARDPAAGYLDAASPLFSLGLFRTPVYPVAAAVVLRAFGGQVAAVIAAQIALGALTVALVAALGSLLAGERAGRWAALVFALDPIPVLYGTVFQPETLFTALLVAAALLWTRALRTGGTGPAAATGVLLGLAVLTRPVGVALPVALAAVALLASPAVPRTRVVAAMGAACLLVTSAWIARNAVMTGTPMLTTVSSINLIDFRAAPALARAEGLTWDEARRRLAARVEARSGPDEGRLDRARNAVALRVLRDHPLAAGADFVEGLVRLFAGSGLTALSALVGDPDPESLSSAWKWPVLTVLLAWMVALYIAVLLGLRSLLRRGARLEVGVCAAFILALALVAAGPSASTRFRVPLVPFLAVLAGAHGRREARASPAMMTAPWTRPNP